MGEGNLSHLSLCCSNPTIHKPNKAPGCWGACVFFTPLILRA
jgi:hypothetical protein